jgi:hypothetical protein
MKGDPVFVILKSSAWLSAKKFENKILGSIVRYPLRPSDDYVPSLPLRYHTWEFQEREFGKFHLDNTHDHTSNFSLALKGLTGCTFKNSIKDITKLSDKQIRCRRLTQHSKFCKSLQNDSSVIEEVPGWISFWNTNPPCLVVGIMTAKAAKASFAHGASQEHGGNLQLPVMETVLPAAGVPLPPGMAPETGDPKIEVDSSGSQETSVQLMALDESIFALELRIVTMAWLQRKILRLKERGLKVNAARLAGEGDGGAEVEEEGKTPDVEDLVLEESREYEFEDDDDE